MHQIIGKASRCGSLQRWREYQQQRVQGKDAPLGVSSWFDLIHLLFFCARTLIGRMQLLLKSWLYWPECQALSCLSAAGWPLADADVHAAPFLDTAVLFLVTLGQKMRARETWSIDYRKARWSSCGIRAKTVHIFTCTFQTLQWEKGLKACLSSSGCSVQTSVTYITATHTSCFNNQNHVHWKDQQIMYRKKNRFWKSCEKSMIPNPYKDMNSAGFSHSEM